MKTHAKKNTSSKSESVANTIQKKQPNSLPFQFKDNRPKTKIQQQFRKVMTGDSTQPIQQKEDTVIQAKAWRERRPLGQADGDTGTTSGLNGRGVLHHAHIVFSRGYMLPIVGESDNVGYHAVHGASGPGELFKENVKSKGYSKVSQLSDSDYDDRLLIQSIKKNEHFGTYKLGTHDCQTWVNKVTADYQAIKQKGEGVKMQSLDEMNADKMADANVKSKNAALMSTHNQVMNSIGNDKL